MAAMLMDDGVIRDTQPNGWRPDWEILIIGFIFWFSIFW